jgi:hypothetical protein
MGHGAKRMAYLLAFSYALCALRRIEEVVMSEEVKIYTTPT